MGKNDSGKDFYEKEVLFLQKEFQLLTSQMKRLKYQYILLGICIGNILMMVIYLVVCAIKKS